MVCLVISTDPGSQHGLPSDFYCFQGTTMVYLVISTDSSEPPWFT